MKNPWDEEGVPWKNETAFYTWLRGVFRRGWSKHPIKLLYKKNTRKLIDNPRGANFKPIWGNQCEQCNEWLPQGKLEVDHVGGYESLDKDNIEPFVKHLFFVTFDNLQNVCKPCHQIRSYATRCGISFEEAAIKKQQIEILKLPVKKLVDLFRKHGYTYNTPKNCNENLDVISKILEERHGN